MRTTSPTVKYVVHIVLFVSWIVFFEFFCDAFAFTDTSATGTEDFDPIERYGTIVTMIMYSLRLISLLVLPQCICNMLGLLLFNGFKEKVLLKAAPMLAPFICFRIVTKGDYPELVRQNVTKNLQTCYEAGIENFMFEVVSDKPLVLSSEGRVRQINVPPSYKTKTGARFKARALQYCLEENVSDLRDDDWVVHLDEETILSTNAVCGVFNFCVDGKHPFGQGLITYAQGEIINWVTTLSDSFRVADDLGKLRFQLSVLHKPLFGWKGSFVVTKLAAERDVSWDHGADGSIAEDCYFSMIAFRDGYSFDFIEGEMYEKSPFTIFDFLQQRKRWLQGIFLTVHSKAIPLRFKLLLGCSLYAWITMPLTTLQVVLCAIVPMPKWPVIDGLVAFLAGVNLYMYLFGMIKSFLHKCRQNAWRLIPYTAGTLLILPFNIFIENLAVLLVIFGRDYDFYVVKKDLRHSVLDV